MGWGVNRIITYTVFILFTMNILIYGQVVIFFNHVTSKLKIPNKYFLFYLGKYWGFFRVNTCVTVSFSLTAKSEECCFSVHKVPWAVICWFLISQSFPLFMP